MHPPDSASAKRHEKHPQVWGLLKVLQDLLPLFGRGYGAVDSAVPYPICREEEFNDI